MTAPRRVSVVVNTYNRADHLAVTLAALGQLDYPDFEVIVVNGPSTDGTERVVAAYAGRIKAATCPERNLSVSRNIGVALAAGDIVAFIDDDAYPDPAWLDGLVGAYQDDEVAGAGGPVFDHTGIGLQSRYLVSDRVGRTHLTFDVDPSRWYNVPGGSAFPSLLGTNSSFRRDRLLEIGGFDEEIEYYLDETDVCARLVDAGYVICPVEGAYVYHEFLPNDIRGANRTARDRYAILKNACYFALKNARRGSSFADACSGLAEFVEGHRADVVEAVARGRLAPGDRDRFEADVPAAFDAGWRHFLAGPAKTRTREWFEAGREPWLAFPIIRPREAKLHICLLSQDYPPRPLGGIGRHVHSLATGLAAAGHVVRVLTKGDGDDRVDLEEGVWVHRVVARPHPAPETPAAPGPIWDHAASLLAELRRIREMRPVDVVQAPNWDAEGLAVLLDGTFTCAVGLYTPMKTLQRLDGSKARDPVATQIAECERFCYQHADALVADSEAVVNEIESAYGLRLPVERLAVIPLGLPDRAQGAAPRPRGSDVTILFVGRLEARKGIDTLLACLPSVLDRCPDARVVLAGRDDLPGPGPLSFRAEFEASPEGQRVGPRVAFLGRVRDDQLAERYATCDVVVAPSRFESFGLILVEAMMFAKPVIGGDVGGAREVVRPGDNGFLVDPDDPAGLEKALVELCSSAELRARFGARSREIYQAQFTVAPMVQRTTALYQRMAAGG